MKAFEVTTRIEAPAERVWEALIDTALKVTTLVPHQRLVLRGGMPLGLFKGERTYTLSPNPDGSVQFSILRRQPEEPRGTTLTLIPGRPGRRSGARRARGSSARARPPAWAWPGGGPGPRRSPSGGAAPRPRATRPLRRRPAGGDA